MKAIDIDFAPASLERSLRRIHPLGWLSLALSLLLGCAILIQNQRLVLQQQQLQSELDKKQTMLQKRQPSKVTVIQPGVPEAQANAINQAVAQLNLPWRDLLNAMEAGTPKTIALLAIEPDAKKQILKGIAEAKDSDSMIDYISELKQQPFFDDVQLAKHETVEQDPNKPLRFQFEAHWNGATP